MCIFSGRFADTILFHHEGGIDIGNVEGKVCLHNILPLCRLTDYIYIGM